MVVLVNSRPTPISGADTTSPAAVVEAWLPGAIGAEPLVAVLFGDENPGGKLPVTIPCSAGQCPTGSLPQGGRRIRFPDR